MLCSNKKGLKDLVFVSGSSLVSQKNKMRLVNSGFKSLIADSFIAPLTVVRATTQV